MTEKQNLVEVAMKYVPILVVYNVMLKFFDREEIEEIEERTRKFIKKEMED